MRNTIGMALLGTTLAVATPTVATGCADDAAKIEKLEAEKVQLIEENTRLSVRAATCEGELTATQRIVGLRQSPVEPVERAINSPRTSPDTAGGVEPEQPRVEPAQPRGEPEQPRVSPLDEAPATTVGMAEEGEKRRAEKDKESLKDAAMKNDLALRVAAAEKRVKEAKLVLRRLCEEEKKAYIDVDQADKALKEVNAQLERRIRDRDDFSPLWGNAYYEIDGTDKVDENGVIISTPHSGKGESQTVTGIKAQRDALLLKRERALARLRKMPKELDDEINASRYTDGLLWSLPQMVDIVEDRVKELERDLLETR